MELNVNRSPSLPAWVMTGLALDAVALAALYTLLAIAGPLAAGWNEWLIALVLIVTRWCVYVVALPTAFRGSSPNLGQVASLFARGLAFITLAALGFPPLGFVCVSIVVIAFRVVTGGAWTSINPETWYAQALGCVAILVMTAPVGAAVGALLHGLRPTGSDVPSDIGRSPRCVQAPSICSDVLGGASAAALAAGGLCAASLLSHPAIVLRYQDPELTIKLIALPQVSPLVVIGVIALLPHLIMTGADSR
jgi:hypothetical protein